MDGEEQKYQYNPKDSFHLIPLVSLLEQAFTPGGGNVRTMNLGMTVRASRIESVLGG